MKKSYLPSIIILFTFYTATSQKSTIKLEEGFQHISLSGQKVSFNLVEYDSYAIVTNGISKDEIYFNLKNGLLDIHVKTTKLKGTESLVILYPKGKPAPKMVSLSEWVALDHNR